MCLKRFLTVQEAADEMGIARSTLYMWIREKVLPVLKIRRTIRIRREDLEKLLQKSARN